jgi:DNA repair ATPase RecN
MKRVKRVLCVVLLLPLLIPVSVRAQEQEIKQLLLDIEKLRELKVILQNMKKGYDILEKGYTAIKDISKGSFDIHKTFLDGLLAVSPTVQKYKRIADIIDYQVRIVKEYTSAYNQFKQDGNFTPEEIGYMGEVYRRLSDLCLKNLDDLSVVITSGKLRMSDDERLSAIDEIFTEIQEEWGFLKHFNNSAKLLALARAKEQQQIDASRKILGLQ